MEGLDRLRRETLRRGWLAVLAAAALGLSACGSGSDAGSDTGSSTGGGASSARIGVVEIAEVPIFDTYVEGFKEGFLKTSGVPADGLELDVKNAQGDNSLIQNFARDLPRDDYAMFVAIGTPVAIALSQQEHERPIVSIAMTDPVGAGVAESLERPGGNVTGTTSFVPPESAVRFLQEMEPSPKRIGTVYDPSNEASKSFTEQLKPLLEQAGMELVEASISGPGDVSTATRSALGRSDALLLGADAIATGAGLPGIVQLAEAQRKPLIVAAGIDPSTKGTLAVLAPDNLTLGRRAGENAGRIFRGEATAATTPFAGLEPDVVVHQDVAERLGITVPEPAS